MKNGRFSANVVSNTDRFTSAGSASTWPKSGLIVASSVRFEPMPILTSAPTLPLRFRPSSNGFAGSRLPVTREPADTYGRTSRRAFGSTPWIPRRSPEWCGVSGPEWRLCRMLRTCQFLNWVISPSATAAVAWRVSLRKLGCEQVYGKRRVLRKTAGQDGNRPMRCRSQRLCRPLASVRARSLAVGRCFRESWRSFDVDSRPGCRGPHCATTSNSCASIASASQPRGRSLPAAGRWHVP